MYHNIDELIQSSDPEVIARNPELAARMTGNIKKPSKYRNIRTESNCRTFQSGREAVRAGELEVLLKAREIFCLEYQVNFPLPGGVVYRADFVYLELSGGVLIPVVEDAKGARTQDYINKSKQFYEKYGLRIREV